MLTGAADEVRGVDDALRRRHMEHYVEHSHREAERE